MNKFNTLFTNYKSSSNLSGDVFLLINPIGNYQDPFFSNNNSTVVKGSVIKNSLRTVHGSSHRSVSMLLGLRN